MRIATLLFEHSADFAKRHDGNISIYALPGIPMLFSALRCLLIELRAGIHTSLLPDEAGLAKLAESRHDVVFIVANYPIPDDLRHDLELLLEVRHEVIHPAHRPAGTPTNTPEYLTALRERGLLQSTGRDSDYVWLSQLQSHRLFGWAFKTIERTATLLVEEHRVQQHAPIALIDSYRSYQRWVAP